MTIRFWNVKKMPYTKTNEKQPTTFLSACLNTRCGVVVQWQKVDFGTLRTRVRIPLLHLRHCNLCEHEHLYTITLGLLSLAVLLRRQQWVAAGALQWLTIPSDHQWARELAVHMVLGWWLLNWEIRSFWSINNPMSVESNDTFTTKTTKFAAFLSHSQSGDKFW